MKFAKCFPPGATIAILLIARASPILTTRPVLIVRGVKTNEFIVEAATSQGQSVSDFAVSTLVHQARSVIELFLAREHDPARPRQRSSS